MNDGHFGLARFVVWQHNGAARIWVTLCALACRAGALSGKLSVTTESPPTPVASHRLNKRVAFERGCSRADAEALILGGWVQVDGVRVEQPQERVRADQVVTIDSKAKAEALQPVTIVWHKPAGLLLPEQVPWDDAVVAQWINPRTHWDQDKSGIRLVRAHWHRLMPLAPMAEKTSGLMALTQREGVARKVSDRFAPLEHEWFVDVAPDKRWRDDDERAAVLRSMGHAVTLDGEPLDRARASWQSELRLRIAVHGTRAGQLAYLCERTGIAITGVRRQRLGRIGLAGLPVGKWRYLTAMEKF
jgi:23S rRNA pseudouridine2604 synthase